MMIEKSRSQNLSWGLLDFCDAFFIFYNLLIITQLYEELWCS